MMMKQCLFKTAYIKEEDIMKFNIFSSVIIFFRSNLRKSHSQIPSVLHPLRFHGKTTKTQLCYSIWYPLPVSAHADPDHYPVPEVNCIHLSADDDFAKIQRV